MCHVMVGHIKIPKSRHHARRHCPLKKFTLATYSNTDLVEIQIYAIYPDEGDIADHCSMPSAHANNEHIHTRTTNTYTREQRTHTHANNEHIHTRTTNTYTREQRTHTHANNEHIHTRTTNTYTR